MSETTAHVYSPSQLIFYAVSLQSSYEASGIWPGDAVPVNDQIFDIYALHSPPEGMKRGADETGQPIWVPLPAPPPMTQSQLAAAMLGGGIEIVSVSNHALNGTYPCDLQTNSDDGNLLAALAAGLTLPNGVAVRVDTSGMPHFFSPQDFKNYCQAKMEFQQQLTTTIGSGLGALPEQPTTIP